MIWYFGLALSLVPFSLGLTFVVRRVDDHEAAVTLPGDIEIRGTTGFAVFTLGLLFAVLSLLRISEPEDPIRFNPTVQKVAGVRPLGGTLRGDERLPRIQAWLTAFERDARVMVDVGGAEGVQRGDYLAALHPDAPAEIPEDLGNLDSDTTALLHVGRVAAPTVKATLAEFAPTEAAAAALTGLSDPVSGAAAMHAAAPVRQGQRVLVIGHDEKRARDRLHNELADADASATPEERRLHLSQVVSLADDFALDHPHGFFAAEVLVMKGDALRRLGELDAAIATFRRFLQRFPGNPRAGSVREKLAAVLKERDAAPGVTFVADTAGARSAGVVPASAIAVRASSTLPARGRVDYDAANLVDGDLATAWSEGSRRTGKGVTIRFRFDQAFDVTGMRVVNGYAKSQTLYDAHTRPRTLRVETDQGRRTVRLRDARDGQSLRLPAGRTRSVAITITGVHPAPLENTMLTEIAFLA